MFKKKVYFNLYMYKSNLANSDETLTLNKHYSYIINRKNGDLN